MAPEGEGGIDDPQCGFPGPALLPPPLRTPVPAHWVPTRSERPPLTFAGAGPFPPCF